MNSIEAYINGYKECMKDRPQNVVHCRECSSYHDGMCRHPDFVSWRMNEKGEQAFRVWDVYRSPDDYCSQGETGDYEHWGFEDDI